MKGAVVCCVIWTPTACLSIWDHLSKENNVTDKSLANEQGFTYLAIEVTSTFCLSFWAVLWYLSADRFSSFEGRICGVVYFPYNHGDQIVLQ